MSDIIRRGKAVALKARRVDPRAETVDIPGVGSVGIPPAVGHPPQGVTQNIIYVNLPAGQAPPPQAAPLPGEIHFHTHVHNYPKRRRGGHGTSFLGTMGLVVGGLACATSYVPQLVWLARPIALVGAGCAAIGFLGSLMFRRVGRVMPLVGLIVSGIGYGLWMVNSGQAKMALPKVISDAIQPLAVASGGLAQPQPVDPATDGTAPSTVDRTKLHDRSIFGDGGNWGNGKNPQQPALPGSGSSSVAAPPVAPVNPSTPAVAIDSATAAVNLESARMSAATRMGVDYATAKAAVGDAKVEYDQVRLTTTPGSPEVQSVGSRYLTAASALTAIQKKLAADPSVAAAELTLKAARAAGR